MSPSDIDLIMRKLEETNNRITGLETKVDGLRDRQNQDVRKMLECQDFFDERYVLIKNFEAMFHKTWNRIKGLKYSATAYMYHIIAIANILFVLGIVTGIIKVATAGN